MDRNIELENFWKVWRVCLELVKDRNFQYDEAYNKVGIEEFKYILNNNLFEIFAKDSNRMIYIKLIKNSKIKTANLKEILEEIKKKTDLKLEIIFILTNKPNSTIKKLENDKSEEIDSLQINCYKSLLFNPTRHILVPKHTRLTAEETNELLETYSLSNKPQLPIILKEDPIVRYYNFKVGDVLKIEKTKGISNLNYNNYRYVR